MIPSVEKRVLFQISAEHLLWMELTMSIGVRKLSIYSKVIEILTTKYKVQERW